MKAIWKREFLSYFQNVIGWLYLAATLALYGLYFFAYNLNYGYAKISYSLNAITFLLLITVPVLTMRSLAEEKKSRTDQLILTSPVSVGKIVFAKYLAMACVHTVAVLVMACTPLILLCFGSIPVAETYVAVLGFWLYGLACIAIGLFVSSLTESQVISAVLTFLLLFAGYMMKNVTGLISSTGNILTKILNCYDLVTPLDTFMDGCLSLTGLVYYLTVTALFLFLATQAIQKRRFTVTRKTWKNGAFGAGFIAVAVALTVIVNLFVGELPSTYTSIDVTAAKLYSLTDQTKDFLKDLKSDVTIYVIAAEKNVDATVSETLKRYEDSSDHITVTYKDPAVNPNFYQNYTDDSVSMGSLIVVCGDVSRVISYNDLFESSVDYSTYSQQTTGYDGEGQITSALQYVTSEDMPVIYQLTGHGETELSGNFSAAVKKANITLDSLNLLESDTVPEDAQAVIINGAASDLSEDDANKLITYMQGGGNVMVALNYQAGELKNLEKVLAEYNITPVTGPVAENDSSHYYQNPFYLLPEVTYTDYSASVGNGYVFVPYAQGVTVPEDTDDVTYSTFLTTSSDAVAKTDAANASSYEYEDGDTKGPLVVGVAAKKTIDDETTAQLVVYGSTEMLTDNADEIVSGMNTSVFTDAITNLVNTGDLTTIVIPSKSYEVSKLTVASFTAMLIGMLIMIVLPLVLLAAGVIIWVRRKKR